MKDNKTYTNGKKKLSQGLKRRRLSREDAEVLVRFVDRLVNCGESVRAACYICGINREQYYYVKDSVRNYSKRFGISAESAKELIKKQGIVF